MTLGTLSTFCIISASTTEKKLRTCAPNEDSDQPAHSRNPISLHWAHFWLPGILSDCAYCVCSKLTVVSSKFAAWKDALCYLISDQVATTCYLRKKLISNTGWKHMSGTFYHVALISYLQMCRLHHTERQSLFDSKSWLNCSLVFTTNSLSWVYTVFFEQGGKQLLKLPVWFPDYQSSSEKGATLPPKMGFAPEGIIVFIVLLIPCQRGGKTILTQLPPLEVYLFHINFSAPKFRLHLLSALFLYKLST